MAFALDGTQALRDTSGFPIANIPISLCGWFYPTTAANNAFVFGVGLNNTRGYISLATAPSGLRWQIGTMNTDNGMGTQNPTSASNTVVANKWQFVYGWAKGDTAYDGTMKITDWLIGYDTTTRTVSGLTVGANHTDWDRVCIGNRCSSASGLTYTGYIAECAAWNTVLTNDEFLSMQKGIKPSEIRPQNLKFYFPGVRNATDIVAGKSLTLINSPTVTDHPRRYG